jgi:hypothetical protein
MATLINLSNATPAAAGGGQNVLWQSDASSPTNVSAYINFANLVVPILINISSTGTGLSILNPTAATGFAAQTNSPTIVIGGQYWTSSASASDTWTVQDIMSNTGGGSPAISTLQITHSGASVGNISLTGVNQVSLPATVVSTLTSSGNIHTSNASFDGSVYTVTSVANHSGSLTTYTGTFGPTINPVVGMFITVAGFTNGANNGRFQVQSSNNTTCTVYNGGGVSETHAATATLDNPYAVNSVWQLLGNGSSGFNISGVSYNLNAAITSYPNSVNLAVESEGNATDTGYFRILTSGATGYHGFEIGSIIDGTGASPIQLQMGVFGGFTGIIIPQPIVATGGGNQSSYPLVIQSSYWTGAASAANSWSIQDVLGTGSNPTTTLTIQQAGTSGAVDVNIISPLTANTLTVGSATPTGTGSQISFGTTTATTANAGANGDVPAQVVGYLTIDIGGTKRKIPYYAT